VAFSRTGVVVLSRHADGTTLSGHAGLEDGAKLAQADSNAAQATDSARCGVRRKVPDGKQGLMGSRWVLEEGVCDCGQSLLRSGYPNVKFE
jgi:hypothetical protein